MKATAPSCPRVAAIAVGIALLPMAAIPAHAGAHDDVLELFETSRLVLLGERHWSRQDSDFRIGLVRAPGFAERVDAVVVEFASSRYQDLLDDYFLSLRPLTRYQLRDVWRETNQTSGAWDSPLYEAFLMALREVNESLPAEQRVRVLAGDPPIDWSSIEVWEDKLPHRERGWSAVRVIEREVLDRGQRALVVYGYGHFLRQDDEMEEDENVVRRLERLHPEAGISVVLPLVRDAGDEPAPPRLDASLRPAELPGLLPATVEPLAGWDAAGLYWGAVGTLGELADAVVYYGEGPDERVGPPEGLYEAEPEYGAELERRRSLRPRRSGGD